MTTTEMKMQLKRYEEAYYWATEEIENFTKKDYRINKIFKMFYMDNMFKTTIATEMNLTSGGVDYNLRRAMNYLIQKIETKIKVSMPEISKDDINLLSLPVRYYNALSRNGIRKISELEECIKNRKIYGMRGMSINGVEIITDSLKMYYQAINKEFPKEMEFGHDNHFLVEVVEPEKYQSGLIYKVLIKDFDTKTRTTHMVEKSEDGSYRCYFGIQSKKITAKLLIDAVKKYENERKK